MKVLWMKSYLSSHVHSSISMTTEQTPSADEDHVIRLKALTKAIKWTLSWNCFISLPIPNNEL